MGTLFKVLIVAAIILGLIGAAGLGIMAVVAGTHDVKKVPVPKTSSLFTMSTMWDFADAYRRPMDFNAYRDIKQVEENVSIKGGVELTVKGSRGSINIDAANAKRIDSK